MIFIKYNIKIVLMLIIFIFSIDINVKACDNTYTILESQDQIILSQIFPNLRTLEAANLLPVITINDNQVNKDCFNHCIYSNNKFIKNKRIGSKGLKPIDPVTNPAEDNWFNRQISFVVFGSENRCSELTQEHFDSITNLECIINRWDFKCMEYVKGNTIYVPIQIGNLTNLKSISFKQEIKYKDLKLNYLKFPCEIKNLNNLICLELYRIRISGKSIETIYTPNLRKFSFCI